MPKIKFQCENSDHTGKHVGVKHIRLTEDFDEEDCYWCNKCRKRDADMVETIITPYENKCIKMIEAVKYSGGLCRIINKIYEDGFEDGINEVTDNGHSTHCTCPDCSPIS